MKRTFRSFIFGALLLAILIALPSHAAKVVTVISAQTIALSTSYTSSAFQVPRGHNTFGLYWSVTGDGTCKFESVPSIDGATYIADETYPIATGQTKTSGPGSDGKDLNYFSPIPCASFKIKCTETGGANSVTVTAKLISISS